MVVAGRERRGERERPILSQPLIPRATSPHTDYLKAIDIWFFMCILFNVLVLLQFGTVIT